MTQRIPLPVLQEYLALIDNEIKEEKAVFAQQTKERSRCSLFLSERIRKLTDFKSKFDEATLEDTDDDEVEAIFSSLQLPTPNTFPYARVAHFIPMPALSLKEEKDTGHVEGLVKFEKELASAITDVEGFSHGWLITANPSDAHKEQGSVCDSQAKSGLRASLSDCVPFQGPTPNYNLILVEIKKVDPKSGEMHVTLSREDAAVLSQRDTWILDFKVYIPFVEAQAAIQTEKE